jgi:hypothetical protein
MQHHRAELKTTTTATAISTPNCAPSPDHQVFYQQLDHHCLVLTPQDMLWCIPGNAQPAAIYVKCGTGCAITDGPCCIHCG